eukprot:2229220-Amphidinium_carterae.2
MNQSCECLQLSDATMNEAGVVTAPGRGLTVCILPGSQAGSIKQPSEVFFVGVSIRLLCPETFGAQSTGLHRRRASSFYLSEFVMPPSRELMQRSRHSYERILRSYCSQLTSESMAEALCSNRGAASPMALLTASLQDSEALQAFESGRGIDRTSLTSAAMGILTGVSLVDHTAYAPFYCSLEHYAQTALKDALYALATDKFVREELTFPKDFKFFAARKSSLHSA